MIWAVAWTLVSTGNADHVAVAWTYVRTCDVAVTSYMDVNKGT